MRKGLVALVGILMLCGATSVFADDDDTANADPSSRPSLSLYSEPSQPRDTVMIGIKGRLWLADFEGDIRAEENNIVGTKIDTDSILDLDPRQEVPEIEAYFFLSDSHRINFHYWTANFEGRNVLTGNITFAGSTYTAGTTVETNLNIDMYTLTYEYVTPLSDVSGVTLGFQIGGKYIDFSGEIDATDALVPFSEKEHFQAPVPVIGARVGIDLGNTFTLDKKQVTLEFQGNGFIISGIRDVKATWYDLIVELDVNPWAGLYGGVGYHLFHVDVQDESSSNDEFELDVDIGGFFFAVGYRF